jgi:hypothetical protein
VVHHTTTKEDNTMKSLNCTDCCWYWQEQDETQPICHYAGLSHNAPCEWDDEAILDEILPTNQKDIKKAFLRQLGRADSTLLSLSAYLGDLEFRRKGEDNWGDVGTMTHFADKLDELYREIEQYHSLRTED